eukprot:TRINITY_DN2583_c0_g1_i1.p1 TRINITY_DN2583_c0_g1~~TRINITY_DN2583_c0_g1_i1.p1  ORF type:complete len:656 (-),score=212.15 TRINITY_DN2583_c0_g1_i1:37-2004(-)
MQNIPWKELAVAGAVTLSVAYAIGRYNGADNLKKKKKQQGGGPRGMPASATTLNYGADVGGGMGMEGAEDPMTLDAANLINMMFEKATKAAEKKNWAEAEAITREGLALLEALPDDPSETAFVKFVLNTRLVEYMKHQKRIKESEALAVPLLEILAKKALAGETISGSHEQDLNVFNTLITDFEFQVYSSDRERAAQIWLEVGEKIGVKAFIIVPACFLAAYRIKQERYLEAEAFSRRALAEYQGTPKDDLWYRVQVQLIESLANQPGKEEEANNGAEAVKEFLQKSTPVVRRGINLAIFGDRLFDMGLYDQAEICLRTAHTLLNQSGEVSQSNTVAASLATLLAQSGRLELAREKMAEVKQYLIAKPSEPPMPLSKYLQTTSAIVHSADGKTYAHIALSCRQQKMAPPVGALLVFHFEHPSSGQEPINFEHEITEDDDFDVKIPLPHVSRSMYIVEISIYADLTKQQKLGTHFVICQSNLTVSPEGIPTRTETTTDTILAGDDTQTVTTVKTTQQIGPDTSETIVKTTQSTNDRSTSEKSEASTVTRAGPPSDRAIQADLAAVAVDSAVSRGAKDTQKEEGDDDEVNEVEEAIMAQLKKKQAEELLQKRRQAEILEQVSHEIEADMDEDDEEEVSLLNAAAPETASPAPTHFSK